MGHASLSQMEQQLVKHLCCREERCNELHQLLLQLLSKGRPVSIASLAEALNWSHAEVEEILAHVPDVERDLTGRVVGWGLTLLTTSHGLRLNGRMLHTWCAFDTLIYPPALAMSAQVDSRCPVTQQRIAFEITPYGLSDVQPTQVVMSLVLPEARADCSRENFCGQAHFFASYDAATAWTGARATPALLALPEAARLGRQVAAARRPRLESER